MARRPSAQKLAALRKVAEGRVTWGDPYPNTTRRRHARYAGTTATDMAGQEYERPTSLAAFAVTSFMVDGSEVYGGEHSTFAAVVESGLAREDHANAREDGLVVPVVLTDEGRAALDKEDDRG